MQNRDEQQHHTPRDVPPVGRPRGAVWRSLQADGVVWEGQVLLVGGDVDLAARLIITHRRVAFVRGGELVLEIPRGWLRQDPVLRRNGVLEIFVATPESDPFDEPMTVSLRMREGHPAAGHIIAMLAPAGVRRIAPDTISALERARDAAPPATYGGFWEDIDPPPARDNARLGTVGAFDDDNAGHAARVDTANVVPFEPRERMVRVSSTPQRAPQGTAFPIAGIAPRDQRRSPWTLFLRLAALTILLATAAALGAGRLNIRLPGAGMGNEAVLIAPTPTEPAAPTEVGAEPAGGAGAGAAISPEDLTAVAVGVGGPAAQATGEAEAAPATASATATESVTNTAATATEPAIPTSAESGEPVDDAPAAPATASAATALAIADDAPASPESTGVTPSAAATQPAAVVADGDPAQEIVLGGLRLALPTAMRAASLPAYGLPPGDGEWVLVLGAVTNDGDEPASLAMSDIRLFDRGSGTLLDLDSGTEVIASLAGMTPARGANDAIALDPGESSEALLLFLLPPGSTDDLALLVDRASIDLGPSLAAESAVIAEQPELLEAAVTEVLGGASIAVEIGGAREIVQYLGIQTPASDACFAAEATAANAQLVEGHSVWLERQATERAADGSLPRDVWIVDEEGDRALVAARLLETGAGAATATPPDTRYAAWLAAAAALGRENGAGMWGSCGEATAMNDDSGSAATSPMLAFSSAPWSRPISTTGR